MALLPGRMGRWLGPDGTAVALAVAANSLAIGAARHRGIVLHEGLVDEVRRGGERGVAPRSRRRRGGGVRGDRGSVDLEALGDDAHRVDGAVRERCLLYTSPSPRDS